MKAIEVYRRVAGVMLLLNRGGRTKDKTALHDNVLKRSMINKKPMPVAIKMG